VSDGRKPDFSGLGGDLFGDLFRGGAEQRERNISEVVRKAAEHKRKAEINEVVVELARETTDAEGNIEIRALRIYRSIVRHVRAGGTVKFVAPDGTEKTLKIRLR